ncbi:TFIIB-type zinc ribbon-containing protein [Geomesophilobacter sediminis]|uniref:Zf-TFIIB domain-containing protein n=1 Tax=Geomesophilobacter sediminis TaxID=2798584 RepID=A0A8J7J6N9_9BACT|nr:zf-TFIIB domain-containing protein [Geomesophilobacter sediminis]MBJ6724511.1 zf-TFIIB domain-containing protein [Geomesophilobacter sediminis]
MNCPACKMVPLTMAERQGVEIDYCPQCRGIWLDRGELDKIIERSYGQQPLQRPHLAENTSYRSSHHDHDQHNGEQGRHRKKSWLSEIFD